MQVPIDDQHRPHQVRTIPSFPHAIPHTCNRSEQPVSNTRCMCAMKPACFKYDMLESNRNWTDVRKVHVPMAMSVTGTACFPQQIHVFITFNLYCVYINIDCAQPEHKKWCIKCMQVPIDDQHRPHQVRTTPSFTRAIPHTCNQSEQLVSNTRCMCAIKAACIQYDMHGSNRNWTDVRKVHVPMAMNVTGTTCFPQ